MLKEIKIDLCLDTKELKKQIKAVLESDISENEKSGIHNLLGYILDEALRFCGGRE